MARTGYRLTKNACYVHCGPVCAGMAAQHFAEGQGPGGEGEGGDYSLGGGGGSGGMDSESLSALIAGSLELDVAKVPMPSVIMSYHIPSDIYPPLPPPARPPPLVCLGVTITVRV